MSWNEGLVDLSLFAYSPTDDRHSALPQYTRCPEQVNYDPIREYYGNPSPNDAAPDYWAAAYRMPNQPVKQAPRLRGRRLCENISIPRKPESPESRCILSRIKRSRIDEQSNNLLQRRHITPAPQLTLSVPEANPGNANSASQMVWMPDEQMWLIVGEEEDNNSHSYSGHQNYLDAEQDTYPTPPAYSPPRRHFAYSAPLSGAQPQWDFTPPLTPIQSQLESLLQPRDEERLSPLFHEAMNSVPMVDQMDSAPPPSYERLTKPSRPRLATSQSMLSQAESHRSVADLVSPLSPVSTRSDYLSRSRTGGRLGSRVRSGTSTSDRSQDRSRVRFELPQSEREPGPSALDELHQQLSGATKSWSGLARRIARPKSAT